MKLPALELMCWADKDDPGKLWVTAELEDGTVFDSRTVRELESGAYYGKMIEKVLMAVASAANPDR
jgi:hypothetical protein